MPSPACVAVMVTVPGPLAVSVEPLIAAGPVTTSVTGSPLLAVATSVTGVPTVAVAGAVNAIVCASFSVVVTVTVTVAGW